MRTKVMLCTVCALVVGAAPAQAAFPGKNGRIAVTSDRPSPYDRHVGDMDIWTFGPNGQHARNLTPQSAGDDWHPRWSADGRRIAFTSNTGTGGDYEVFVMNADGSGRRQITFNELDEDRPGWSPDGRRIVFDRWNGDADSDILTIRADGGGEINLTNGPGIMDRQPSWSPDGRVIAFSRDDHTGQFGNLWTVTPDGRHQRQLTFASTDEEAPTWSPDGRRIAFNSDAGGDFDLWAMPAFAGAAPVNLSNAPASGDGGGAWSPDGRKLLFGSNRDDDGNPADEDHDLYKMRADGSHQRNITRDEHFETSPDWQPLAWHERAEDDDD